MKTKQYTKRFFALAMSLCMIFGMMPMSAHATGTTHEHVWSSEWSGDGYYHWHNCTADGCDLGSTGDGKDGFGYHEVTSDTHSDSAGFAYHVGTCNVCGNTGAKVMKGTVNGYNDTQHWEQCECGEGEKRFVYDHAFDNEYDPDCNDGCGYTREVETPPHTHDWVWTWDDSNHWQKCSDTTCGESSTASQEHQYDDDADAICDTCGYEREVDHEHTYSTTIGETDEEGHYYFCTYTGGCEEYTFEEHSFSDATCQAPATCSCGDTTGEKNPDNHTGGTEIRDAKEATEAEDGYTGDTYCKGCGEKIADGDVIPKLEHTHEWSEWTSDREGNHIRVCATNSEHRQLIGCSDGSDSDELCDTCGYNMHPHNYTVFYNDDVHWEECSCGAKRNQAEHSYSDDSDSSCDCGYTRIIEHTHKWSEWTSDGEGKHIRECSYIRPHTETADCSDGADRDKLCDTCGYDLHEHTYDVVKYNNTYHWTECICGDMEIRDFHKFDDDYDDTCDCGYTREINHEHEWSEWLGSTKSHYRTCLNDKCSGYEMQDHDWGYGSTFDNICDICGYEKAVHSCVFEGGNCVTESTCACGAKGEKNPSVHTGETKLVNAYEAVGLTDGYTGDTRCSSCNALLEKGEVIPAPHQIVKPVDGDGMYEGNIEVALPSDSVTDDTKVVVGEYTVADEDHDEFGASTGLTPVPELEYDKLEILTNEDYNNNHITTYQGTDYPPGSIVTINGRDYLVTGSDSLVDMNDGLFWKLVGNELIRETVSFDGKVEKLEDTYVTINGVVYDAIYQYYGVTYLYIDGEPAGFYSNPSGEQLNVKFYPGKDPESVKKASKYPSFSFNPPADSTIGGVEFEAGQLYDATAIAATDISVTGALINPDEAEQAARAKVEELKKKMLEAYQAHREAWASEDEAAIDAATTKLLEAVSEYNAALSELEKYQVKHTIAVPEEYVGDKNVSYIAVHYGELGAEIGEVAVSEDGKTLNVTYAVSDFSPFVIYAITEREEVEIQKTVLTGITIDENPTTDEPTTSPQTSDSWIWYVLIAVAAGAVIVVSVIYGKRRRSKVN